VRCGLLAGLFAGLLAISGCTGGGPDPSAQGPAPMTALSGSIAAATSQRVHFDAVRGTVQASGDLDPAGRIGSVQLKATVETTAAQTDVVQTPADAWVRLDAAEIALTGLPVAPDSWQHMVVSRLGGQAALPLDLSGTDLLDLAGVLAGVRTVRRSGIGQYTGTVDLTRMSGVSRPTATEIAAAGDAARSLPYDALLDAQGRLIRLTVQSGRGAPGLAMQISLSNYGSTPTVAVPAPAAQAPAEIYAIFTQAEPVQ
jgi:hypothetical protein